MSNAAELVSGAADALKRSSHPAIRKLFVEETSEALILSGRVCSYYLKQLAQETVMSSKGNRSLVNLVAVEPA